MTRRALASSVVLGLGFAASTTSFLVAQGGRGGGPVLDRLATMAPYQQFAKRQPLYQNPMVTGALNVTWVDGGRAFTYNFAGKAYRFDATTMQTAVTGEVAEAAEGGRGAGRGGGVAAGGRGGGRGGATTNDVCPQEAVDRGRQRTCYGSLDGTMRAFYRDHNLWISKADGTGEKQITTDGSEAKRIKYGSGSWVYGEELGQTSAIWWSPDSRQVAFYRFDESPVKDFYLQMDQTQIQTSLDVEAYPKAGAPNPIAEVFVYDVASGRTTKLDVRDGKPFTDIPADGSKFANDAPGHYVYRVSWRTDSSEILMNRTNRRQNVLEFVACSSSTTKCRVIVGEESSTGWVQNSPTIQWLADNRRFIWASERNGFRNLYLYDVSGTLLNPITTHTKFEVAGITKVDEAAGVVYYTARSGDNFMKLQLHRVGLNGQGDRQLTDPAFTHTVSIAPDNKLFVDVYQTHKDAPATRVVDMTGKVVAELAKSDLTRFKENGLRPVEMFTYKAADGITDLYGTISFPTDFDPAKKYPLLAAVYGGPASGGNVPTENFATPSANAEYGFLIVSVGSRSVPGRGKRLLDQVYMKLGIVEMDDMAAGIRSLWSRPYVDKGRAGIYGTSYGGYTSALSILKHPDVWTAAAASSSVTSWYHYDSIYTERYMWIPQENKENYEAGNAMNYAKNLKGRLLIYYGTADNNVHPNNSMQLIKALQQAGKSFEVQVGPDLGHTGVNSQRMMEFFIENLILRPDRLISGS